MAGNDDSLVTLRGKTYFENFTVEGIRYRGSLKTQSKELAKIIAGKRKSDLQLAKLLGKKPERIEMTLDAAFGKYWLDYAHKLPSAPTIAVHFIVLRNGLGGNTLLSEVNADMLDEYATKRGAGEITHREDSKRKGVPVANSTVNNELHRLQAVMNRARKKWRVRVAEIEWKDVLLEDEGERQHILTRRADDVDGHPLSNQPDEETRLFDALRDDMRALTRFMLIGGLRLANVVDFTWDQVQWAEGRIEFRLKSKKKLGKLHYLPITPSIREILMGERGRHPTQVFTFVCRKTDPKREQVKGQRYPMTRANFQSEWQRARKEAGLWYGKKDSRNLRVHDLRHTAATRALVKAGGNIKTVQKFLGHSKVATTVRYLKADVSDVAAAMD